jgi:hypothetical protein
MPHSKSGGSNWNTVKARILRQIITAKFGTATANIFRVDGPALVKRSMKKEINYPTELELPEKVVTERPNKRYY